MKFDDLLKKSKEEAQSICKKLNLYQITDLVKDATESHPWLADDDAVLDKPRLEIGVRFGIALKRMETAFKEEQDIVEDNDERWVKFARARNDEEWNLIKQPAVESLNHTIKDYEEWCEKMCLRLYKHKDWRTAEDLEVIFSAVDAIFLNLLDSSESSESSGLASEWARRRLVEKYDIKPTQLGSLARTQGTAAIYKRLFGSEPPQIQEDIWQMTDDDIVEKQAVNIMKMYKAEQQKTEDGQHRHSMPELKKRKNRKHEK